MPCAKSKQAAVLKQPAGHAPYAGDCIRLIRLGTAAMCAERLQRVSHPVNMYTQANSVYGQRVPFIRPGLPISENVSSRLA